jgi:hypothetical protein
MRPHEKFKTFSIMGLESTSWGNMWKKQKSEDTQAWEFDFFDTVIYNE